MSAPPPHSSTLLRLLTAGLWLAAGVAPLAAQETGIVAGRALQQESGAGLQGAQIRVEGTTLGVMTDASGRFVLLRVPAGTRTLELSALGRETLTREVTVRPGETAVVEFAAPYAAVAVAGLEVLGSRAMTQARALSQQKNAPNIVNVVASDQIGRFPDVSAPEALQRLPGITLQRDQGEGRYVHIRGGTSDFTQVNINGASAPSPEGEERRVALDAVPVDILESIEVTKAITPDMEASAVGGSVNLVTRKAPDSPFFSLDLSGGYAPIREEPAGKGALAYGRRLADGRLGFLLVGSYSTRRFGSDDAEPEYDLGDTRTEDVLTELSQRYYTLERNRLGTTAAFDFRASERSLFTLTGTYTEHQDTEQRRALIHGIEDGEILFEHKNRLEKLQIGNVTFGGEHQFSGISVDYGIGYSRSSEDTPSDREIAFLQEGVTFSPDLSDPGFIQANPAGGATSGAYVFEEHKDGTSLTTNTDLMGHLDLTLPYGLGDATGEFKFGGRVLDKQKDLEVWEQVHEWSAAGDPVVLGQGIGAPFRVSNYNPGNYAFQPFSTTDDEVLTFPQDFAGQITAEEDLEKRAENFDLEERVVGLYAMTELNLTPDLMLLPGVRWEGTTATSEGFEFNADDESITPTRGEKDHGNLFPMAHLRYRMGDQTNVRAAYTTTIFRPNFWDLAPYRLREDNDLEIGNPDLEPAIGRSFDLLLEHYDSRIGVMSAGVFYKRINDPIFGFVSDNELGGETSQPGNGESATIRGAEVAFNQQLSFLPAPFDGLGIYANYTYTDSEGVLGDGREAALLGQADHTVNTALSWERGGFSGQFSLNYHNDYVDEYGDSAIEDVYVAERHQLDFSADYNVRGSGTLYLQLNNLTNQPFRLRHNEIRPRQIEYYRPWATIGFRYAR